MAGTYRDDVVEHIKEILAERSTQGDKNVKVLGLGSQEMNQGTGCDWNPNVVDNARMAAILSAELGTSLGW